MTNISVLDCTLRDGGYCNEWQFGHENIKKIIRSLSDSGVEIVECGFLTNRIEYNHDITKFKFVDEISSFLPEDYRNRIYVAMMNYGEYNPDDLPKYDGNSIDGIRLAFHKKDCLDALKVCKEIRAKGYLVFVQPMVSLSYNDKEFLEMIDIVNTFEPYAFYIVDSFGEMKKQDLIRLFNLVDHNLKTGIRIGFHSHNNMQLAFSNARRL